ncbi:hypothetical protein [Marivita geojedonensis]|uniref:TVP38/TMEM64 family membrane protein n=1 Tax=Marivita geojedonensis TaxID=1123756 RepID=A0A1X4NMI5_9RHOB|nr:hypothetical protein [Marivita geojedonensis]OSQ51484.1 hypothetical protein MGEO_08490 [Marivita geojedonensis]PRY77835.1 hypothetical protein CLV76_10721 [Marivita geojedonensis]
MTTAPPTDTRFFVGLALRLIGLIILLLAAVYFAAQVKEAIGFAVRPDNEEMVRKLILLGLIAYILLTALPFVPGAEIGMTLPTVFGAQMAPLIYLATILSLLLAYSVGRVVSLEKTAGFLRRVGLVKLPSFLETLCQAPKEDRPKVLIESTGHPALRRLALYRYVALALLINTPGNSVIGGGGGLSFAAGLSDVFTLPKFLLTIFIAVLPVPLAVFLFGV